MATDTEDAVIVSSTPAPAATKPTTAVATVEKKEAAESLRDVGGMKLAQLCVASGLFKDTADVAKAAMKMKLGYALGIDEATAMTNLILVNGRMSFTATFVAGRIRTSGKYRYKVIEKSDKQCKIQFFEKVDKWEKTSNGMQLVFDWETSGPPEVFSVEMAKRAGLTKNETWTKYPEAMCFARCLTAGARTYCSDVFLGNGVYTPDELDPTLPTTLNDNGEIVVDESPAKKPATKAAKKDVVADVIEETSDSLIKEIQALAKEMKVDTAPFAKLYGVDDMKKLTVDQLRDFKRKLEQRKASP